MVAERFHSVFADFVLFFGGVYCLKRSIKEIFFTEIDEKLVFDAIQCDNQRIQAKNIVFGHGTISNARFEKATGTDNANKHICGNLSRGIFITDTPIGDENLNSGGGGVIFLKMPSTTSQSSGAFVMQLSHWSGCCPKGYYLIHITCQSSESSPKNDLNQYVEKLFKKYHWQEPDEVVVEESSQTEGSGSTVESKPQMLWSMYFNIPICLKCEYADETPIPGLHLSCGPYFELDYDKSIEDAKNLFTKIYPKEEFLPRAPDPDEIIIGDDDDENIKLDIQEKIADVVEGIENEVQCIQENDLNESKSIE